MNSRLSVASVAAAIVLLAAAACSAGTSSGASVAPARSSPPSAASAVPDETIVPTATAAPTPTADPTPRATPIPTDGSPSTAVSVVMTDAMRFEPGSVTVPADEPVTFTVRNAGTVVHEFYVGTPEAQQYHALEMVEHAGHGMIHPDALSLAPGEIGTITFTFDDPGQLMVACHEPGHFAAGMIGSIEVVG